MKEKISNFHESYDNDSEFKIKVLIGHILVAKVFLDPYFEKYYINFFNNSKFDETSFKKSIGYIDIMFYWDNYNDRYSLFESRGKSIIELLFSQKEISQSIKDSLVADIIHIIGKKDNSGEIILNPYDINFLDNDFWINEVKKWIQSFLSHEIRHLNEILYNLETTNIRSSLIKDLKEIMW